MANSGDFDSRQKPSDCVSKRLVVSNLTADVVVVLDVNFYLLDLSRRMLTPSTAFIKVVGKKAIVLSPMV